MYVEIREHPRKGVYIENQRVVKVSNVNDVIQLIESSNAVRHTASTKINDKSSRSHAIVMIMLK